MKTLNKVLLATAVGFIIGSLAMTCTDARAEDCTVKQSGEPCQWTEFNGGLWKIVFPRNEAGLITDRRGVLLVLPAQPLMEPVSTTQLLEYGQIVKQEGKPDRVDTKNEANLTAKAKALYTALGSMESGNRFPLFYEIYMRQGVIRASLADNFGTHGRTTVDFIEPIIATISGVLGDGTVK